VGGSQTLRVDTRLITATNRNLEEMVEEGSYRQDLFYRLNVVAIKIPPLRECRDDIPLLVNEFLREFCVENDKELRGMSPEVMDLLTDYDWPGNVRELKNCLEGMVVMAKAGVELSEADIPAPIRKAPRHQSAGGITAGRTMLEIEREAIVVTLKAVDYDRRRAAQMLGIGLSTLYRKEKEYGLRTVSGDDS
jgi:two-component system response regulator HydG